jgi:glutamine amidotransferase/cyclase
MLQSYTSAPCVTQDDFRAPLRTHTARRKRAVAVRAGSGSGSDKPKEVTLLDYGVGNVRSVRNAIKYLGYTVRDVQSASDITSADRLIFPGVGSFGAAMDILNDKGFAAPLKDYLAEGEPSWCNVATTH